MIQSFVFAVALLGSSIAAVYDLKTTEIPDKISYSMIAIALLVYGTQSLIEWNYMPILNSAVVGAALFGFGFVLYYLGQWGGGDVKLLSAIGFLLPSSNVLSSTFPKLMLWFPFPVSYLFNVFFVGATYMIVYALILTVMNRKIIHEFKRDVKASANIIALSSAVLFVVFLFINWFFAKSFAPLISNTSIYLINLIVPVVFTIGLFLLWKYVRAVEKIAFKKRVHVNKLNVGDVLMSSKVWEGLTEKELKRIQRSKKRYVWIKEGVRFAPAFPLALLFTIYFGDAIMFLFRIFV